MVSKHAAMIRLNLFEKRKCKFWKKYKENCPNYIETTWAALSGNQPYLVKDCAPKRAVIMTMDLSNRLLGLQKELNVEREAQHQTASVLADMIQLAQQGMIQVVSSGRELKAISQKEVEDADRD